MQEQEEFEQITMVKTECISEALCAAALACGILKPFDRTNNVDELRGFTYPVEGAGAMPALFRPWHDSGDAIALAGALDATICFDGLNARVSVGHGDDITMCEVTATSGSPAAKCRAFRRALRAVVETMVANGNLSS